jgi:hypothetical protein
LVLTKDISLEKISPLLLSENPYSWKSCTDSRGGTPGKENSKYVQPDTNEIVNVHPNPFSPFSSGDDHFCKINFLLPFSNSVINASVYNLQGAKLRTLVSSAIYLSEGELIWDGKNDEGSNLQVGPYILIFEATNSNTQEILQKKILVVIGK